jgi:hypothetical protein
MTKVATPPRRGGPIQRLLVRGDGMTDNFAGLRAARGAV